MCPSGTSLPESSGFRQAFNALDGDGDGLISREDLRAFISDRDDDAAINAMMAVADANADGFVDFKEFEFLMRRMESGRKSGGGEVMEEVFRLMDKDGDGRLSHADLKSYLGSAGFDASDEDVGAMMGVAGADHRGVSYDGFLKILNFQE